MEKDKKPGGAVRKTEGAKAPEVSPSTEPEKELTEEAKAAGGAPVELTETQKKAKKAANDKASKIKREKEAAAKKVAEAEAAGRCGFYIKPGLAITSNKGIVAGAPKGSDVWEGDKVTSNHFSEDVSARLFESGAIVEVK